MKNPSIENIIKHNKKLMEKTLEENLDLHYRAEGWIEALNYITNNYKLEEK